MSSSEPKWTTPLYQIVQYVYILPWTQSAFTAPDPSQGSLYTSKRDKIKPNLMLSFLPNGIVSNRYRLFYFMEPDVHTTVIPRMSITSVSIKTSRFPAVASMGYFLFFFFGCFVAFIIWAATRNEECFASNEWWMPEPGETGTCDPGTPLYTIFVYVPVNTLLFFFYNHAWSLIFVVAGIIALIRCLRGRRVRYHIYIKHKKSWTFLWVFRGSYTATLKIKTFHKPDENFLFSYVYGCFAAAGDLTHCIMQAAQLEPRLNQVLHAPKPDQTPLPVSVDSMVTPNVLKQGVPPQQMYGVPAQQQQMYGVAPQQQPFLQAPGGHYVAGPHTTVAMNMIRTTDDAVEAQTNQPPASPPKFDIHTGRPLE